MLSQGASQFSVLFEELLIGHKENVCIEDDTDVVTDSWNDDSDFCTACSLFQIESVFDLYEKSCKPV